MQSAIDLPALGQAPAPENSGKDQLALWREGADWPGHLLPLQQDLFQKPRSGAMCPGFCKFLYWGHQSQALENAQTPVSLVLGNLPQRSTGFALLRDARVGPPNRGGGLYQ